MCWKPLSLKHLRGLHVFGFTLMTVHQSVAKKTDGIDLFKVLLKTPDLDAMHKEFQIDVDGSLYSGIIRRVMPPRGRLLRKTALLNKSNKLVYS